MSGDLKTVFWEAIRSLATGDESIQARLGGAALRLGSLRPEDLPETSAKSSPRLCSNSGEGREG
jgi:hypothetical protein